jgi:hypothetical protein
MNRKCPIDMITPEMFDFLDRSPDWRRLYYIQLHRALQEMADLSEFLNPAQLPMGHLDIIFRDRDRQFAMVVIRPDSPDTRPRHPHKALDLVEYLIGWAIGTENIHAAAIAEMDARYPQLRLLTSSDLMPAQIRAGRVRPGNWLKRAYKAIFG